MAAQTVRVVVFDTQIHAMFAPGGPVYEEARRSAQEVSMLAKLDVHSRTAQLAASIRIASETRVSRKTVGFYVRADAPHAYWVHEGTGPEIFPTTFPFMRLPAYPEMGPRGTAPRIYRKVVAGQEGQQYLTKNLRYVMSEVAL